MFDEVAPRLMEQIAHELSSPEVVFPTSFDLTIRVQSILKDPNVSIDKLTQFIRTEPLMSSRIMAYANSVAIRGVGSEIVELHSAILRIGLDAVRTVSYTLAVEQIIRSKHMMPFQEFCSRVWEHSLAVATLCRKLARQARLSPERAFFMGMIHDIGAFYLMFRCSQYSELASDRERLVELVFEWHDGIGHALLTAMNSQSDDILSAVQDHEAPVTITKLANWNMLLACADSLGVEIVDWAPADLRAQNDRIIAEELLDAETREQLLRETGEEMATLRATLF